MVYIYSRKGILMSTNFENEQRIIDALIESGGIASKKGLVVATGIRSGTVEQLLQGMEGRVDKLRCGRDKWRLLRRH
jgi:hypothetical protein